MKNIFKIILLLFVITKTLLSRTTFPVKLSIHVNADANGKWIEMNTKQEAETRIKNSIAILNDLFGNTKFKFFQYGDINWMNNSPRLSQLVPMLRES
ncbi:MAG: hypothetical protein K9J12_18610 [Melioribacteraceae bacterium]|nr:hypothetical protein [Melioribacteraceae bacterium]MCF8266240.1 hypothetical protein [Melioribacteraceae bacterium]